MIVNRNTLLRAAPIKFMERYKQRSDSVTYGMSEAGYDIRIKQDVVFNGRAGNSIRDYNKDGSIFQEKFFPGRFVIASAIEEFDMPHDLVGIVHDKSSWARRGLSVFNTVIEPGWKGFLTLELVYHGDEILRIPAGSGIAQVVFHQTTDRAKYHGRYQNQANKPVPAKAIE